MRLRTLIATAIMLAVVAAGGVAEAHARVVATSPSEGQTVRGDLTRVVVRFDDVVTLVPHALTVTTDVGVPVSLENPRIVGGKTLEAVVQDHLAPGRYAVAWRIQADDGHIESSSFGFTVVGNAAAAGHAMAAMPTAPPPSPAEPLWPVLVAAGIAVAAGVGAGFAVRRGLRLVAAGSAYPVQPDLNDLNGQSPRRDAALRLPM